MKQLSRKVSGETDETISGSVETMEQELREWTRDQQQVNHITEQMGFLSSETHGGKNEKHVLCIIVLPFVFHRCIFFRGGCEGDMNGGGGDIS